MNFQTFPQFNENKRNFVDEEKYSVEKEVTERYLLNLKGRKKNLAGNIVFP